MKQKKTLISLSCIFSITIQLISPVFAATYSVDDYDGAGTAIPEKIEGDILEAEEVNAITGVLRGIEHDDGGTAWDNVVEGTTDDTLNVKYDVTSTGTICDSNACIADSQWDDISSPTGIEYTGGDVGIGLENGDKPLGKLHLHKGVSSKPPLVVSKGSYSWNPDTSSYDVVVGDGNDYWGIDAGTDFGIGNSSNNDLLYITSGGNVGIGTITPSQKLEVSGGNIQIDNTTNSNQDGIVYKDLAPFIHNFNYGDNGTVTTLGENTFVGEYAGNLTMGSTATEVYHGSYNTAIGQFSLHSNTIGYKNTAVGRGSLRLNTTGVHNTANGYASLYSNTTGDNNTANGYTSLYSNTTGYQNTALGYASLRSNTTGYQNTALGYASLRANTTGYHNTSLGMYSLFKNTTGHNNTSNGYASLYFNTTGYQNTAFGYASLHLNTTGYQNTALGLNSGRYIADGSTGNTTGDFNTFLGYNTKALGANDQNEIVIGAEATGIGSNSVVLGSDNITKTALKGSVGIGITTPVAKLDVNGGIKFGDDTDVCDTTKAGTTRYNSTENYLELCNGTSWEEIGVGTANSENGDAAFITCTNEQSDGDGINDVVGCVEAATLGTSPYTVGTSNYIQISCTINSGTDRLIGNGAKFLSGSWQKYAGSTWENCDDGSMIVMNLNATSGSGGMVYTSPEQTIINAGSLTLAHGLGSEPKFTQVYLVNKVAEGGYSVGDKTVIHAQQRVTSGTANGFSLSFDNTNINIRIGDDGLRLVDKTTGGEFTITNANWKLVVVASTGIGGESGTTLPTCTDGQTLSYNETNSVWECSDNTGGSGSWVHSGVEVFNASAPTSWTDLDLSSVVGAKNTLVTLKFEMDGTGTMPIYLKTKSDSGGIHYLGATTISLNRGEVDKGQDTNNTNHSLGYINIETSSLGMIEWTVVKLDGADIVKVTVAGYIGEGSTSGTTLPTCTDGQTLSYNETNSVWECSDNSASGTSLPTCTDGQILTYNETGSEWECSDNTGSSSSEESDISVKIRKSSPQSIPDVTWTTVTWDTEDFDTSDMHDNSINNSRITIPSGASGKYLIIVEVVHDTNSSGTRWIALNKNGAATSLSHRSKQSHTHGDCMSSGSWILDLDEFDYLEVKTYQTSGVSLNVETERSTFTVYKLSSGSNASGTTLPTCTDGQILTYNETGSVWECTDNTNGTSSFVGNGSVSPCKQILEAGDSSGDGVYSFDPDGAGAESAYDVYCDMTTDGGGWTFLAHVNSNTSSNDFFVTPTGTYESSRVDNGSLYSLGKLDEWADTEMYITLDTADVSTADVDNKLIFYEYDSTSISFNNGPAPCGGVENFVYKVAEAGSTYDGDFETCDSTRWYTKNNSSQRLILYINSGGNYGTYWGSGLGGDDTWYHDSWVYVR